MVGDDDGDEFGNNNSNDESVVVDGGAPLLNSRYDVVASNKTFSTA